MSLLKCPSSQEHFAFAGDVSQTEPEEDTQANTEETEDTNERNGTSINDADNCERLEGNNSLSQETESAEHTHVGSNTEAGDHSGKRYQ